MSTITARIRRRRDERAFEYALRTASPSMQHELMAQATRMQGGQR